MRIPLAIGALLGLAAATLSQARPSKAQRTLGQPDDQSAPTRPPLPDDRADGAAAIAEDDLRSWLETLTSAECAGRDTGTDGFVRAAELVRDHFQALGLEPAGDDGTFWQRVPWSRSEVDGEASALAIRKGDEVVCRLTPGGGLHGNASLSTSTQGQLAVAIVREGGGPELRDLDVDGKIVLVHAPGRRVPERALAELGRAGAAALIAVDDEACARLPSFAVTTTPGRGAANRAIRGRGRVTSTRLSVPTARFTEILAAAGKTPEQVDATAPLAVLDGLSAQLELVVVERAAPAFNVAAVLRGEDPAKANEYVVIGSHLDHLGSARGRICPGADDDGSGTVGVMAVAQAFAHNPVRPARSVLFATFCGEENGLIGSRWFTEHPPIPLAAMAAEIQMDMIGRREESEDEGPEDNANSLHLIGTQKLSPELHELWLARNAAHAGFELEWDEEDVFFRSDHFSFARRGVPIAFLFTGFHPDYHQPSDTADKIDYDKLRRVAVYAYDVAFELATAPARPHVDAAKWQQLRRELRGQLAERPVAPMREDG